MGDGRECTSVMAQRWRITYKGVDQSMTRNTSGGSRPAEGAVVLEADEPDTGNTDKMNRIERRSTQRYSSTHGAGLAKAYRTNIMRSTTQSHTKREVMVRGEEQSQQRSGSPWRSPAQICTLRNRQHGHAYILMNHLARPGEHKRSVVTGEYPRLDLDATYTLNSGEATRAASCHTATTFPCSSASCDDCTAAQGGGACCFTDHEAGNIEFSPPGVQDLLSLLLCHSKRWRAATTNRKEDKTLTGGLRSVLLLQLVT